MKKATIKKIFVFLCIFALILSAVVVYLNRVVLPTRVKAMVVKAIEDASGKNVSLGAVKINILKGVVLDDLVIYDKDKNIVSIKQLHSSFLLLPIFKKVIILPAITIDSAVIYLERRVDNSFNLAELFQKKAPEKEEKRGFNLIVYKIALRNANVQFVDKSLKEPFSKEIRKINLNLSLSLPAGLKYGGNAQIQGASLAKIFFTGQYQFKSHDFLAKISWQNFAPGELEPYYKGLGFSLPQGLLSGSAQIESKNKELVFSGNAKALGIAVSFANFAQAIKGLNSDISFDNSGIDATRLEAEFFGIPACLRLTLKDYSNASISVKTTANLDLGLIQQAAKEKFNLDFPAQLSGEAGLEAKIQGIGRSLGNIKLDGNLDIIEAAASIENPKFKIEGISGRLGFDLSKISWQGLSFRCLDKAYKTSGVLVNLLSPQLKFNLSSDELFLESELAINKKLVKVNSLSGKYLGSGFSLSGNIDAGSPKTIFADLAGKISLNLADLSGIMKKQAKEIEKIKPAGIVDLQVGLEGDLNNPKFCLVQLAASSQSISAWGLKSGVFNMDLRSADGILDIPLLHISLYDGSFDASAKMNMNSGNLPFTIEAGLAGVQLGKLKEDTPAKKSNISGVISGQARLNGYGSDIAKISGAGSVLISQGKLWELNLFQGLGKILLGRDFSNILFEQGSCNFTIQDRFVVTDNLKLKGNFANLSGTAKVGLDSSIDAVLNVEILSEAVPATGTIKDVATAILGEAGSFGVIKIGGTLQQPKTKFVPAVTDIIKGIKNTFFGKPSD